MVVMGKGNDPHFIPPQQQQNSPDSTVEVMLDIQMAGSLAPGAKLVMYFTDFTRQGWVNAISQAVNDTTNNPSVLSISYGNPEDASELFPGDMVEVVSAALETAKAKGITVCVASGDNGSTDGVTDGNQHVDFPASSPWVLGCGGTSLKSSKRPENERDCLESGRVRRRGWGASGGGVSTVFGPPDSAYQTGVGVPSPSGGTGGRGVPDVSGLADPNTGVQVVDVRGNFDKQNTAGGTSATAPLWAALIARMQPGIAGPDRVPQHAALHEVLHRRPLRRHRRGQRKLSRGPGLGPLHGPRKP